jgi:hypothetical protein
MRDVFIAIKEGLEFTIQQANQNTYNILSEMCCKKLIWNLNLAIGSVGFHGFS